MESFFCLRFPGFASLGQGRPRSWRYADFLYDRISVLIGDGDILVSFDARGQNLFSPADEFRLWRDDEIERAPRVVVLNHERAAWRVQRIERAGHLKNFGRGRFGGWHGRRLPVNRARSVIAPASCRGIKAAENDESAERHEQDGFCFHVSLSMQVNLLC